MLSGAYARGYDVAVAAVLGVGEEDVHAYGGGCGSDAAGYLEHYGYARRSVVGSGDAVEDAARCVPPAEHETMADAASSSGNI